MVSFLESRLPSCFISSPSFDTYVPIPTLENLITAVPPLLPISSFCALLFAAPLYVSSFSSNMYSSLYVKSLPSKLFGMYVFISPTCGFSVIFIFSIAILSIKSV